MAQISQINSIWHDSSSFTNGMRLSHILRYIKLKVAKPAVQETPIAAAEAPVHNQHPAAAPAPAYQPFDYRKFFDFSFFGNLGSQFGGNPQGFQLPAKKEDRLVSYTVQKEFAHRAPQEQAVPAVQLTETQGVDTAAPAAGIEKTVYIAPFTKHHYLRRHHPHHHKRVQVVKTYEIQ